MRDPDGILVHSHDCLQNAMIHIGIGAVFAHPDWETAFGQAAAALAEQMAACERKPLYRE